MCSPTELEKERGESSFLDEKNKQYRIICHVSVCLVCKSRQTTASAIKNNVIEIKAVNDRDY